MNLYQINTGVENPVIQSAGFDLRLYTDYLDNTIKYLENETLSIRIKKETVGSEVRYFPEPFTTPKEEKAIEILFNENTKYIFHQKKDFNSRAAIDIVEKNEDDNYFILTKEIKEEVIYLKPDTYQLVQQSKALKNLRHRPLKEHEALLRLFGFPDSSFWNQKISFNNTFDWEILTDYSKDGIYEQQDFVKKAFYTKDFGLLEGPPGSGKTTTIIELIIQLVKEGKRVLLCSATHAAIDNVIERVMGRYKDICEKEIVPVRISREISPVKESVRPYLIKNLVTTYKTSLERHLKAHQKSESQKYLLETLHKDDKLIDQVILDSANLVAGTMIGILQHPDIKSNKQGASFDVLIVDEASKVTFSDFIVPALHAKKWILVGDVKQLSPYVEDDYVSENISKLIEKEEQVNILKRFELLSKVNNPKFDDCIKVFFTDEEPAKEKLYVSSVNTIIDLVDIDWVPDDLSIAKLNSANIVIAKNDKRIRDLLAKHIFVKSIFINGEATGLLQNYRQLYFRSSERSPAFKFDSKSGEWPEMVASRLNQSFSFRNASEEFSNIDKELDFLIPDELKESINQIRRLVFPSILELLQKGIGKTNSQRNNKVISDGFTSYAKSTRFTALTFQHRMHPEIAQTSKDNFYSEFNGLQSANTVLNDRGWRYRTNEPVVKWIHNNDSSGNSPKGQIINPTEVKDIENELSKFLHWASSNPNISKEGKIIPYEVAILSFYLNQETLLRIMLRKICKQRNFSRFQLPNVHIFLYTVDKFQGQEADFVLLGFTKFTKAAHYNSPNRLNVALTRARHKLVLFGNRKWFAEKAKLKALRDLGNNYKSSLKAG
ncbi:MAG: AAA family ATPase [Bacteroidia bacterium]|nr:AAA family ATPase [Bacteroidia bacterium]